jgi:hypothetical protein
MIPNLRYYALKASSRLKANHRALASDYRNLSEVSSDILKVAKTVFGANAKVTENTDKVLELTIDFLTGKAQACFEFTSGNLYATFYSLSRSGNQSHTETGYPWYDEPYDEEEDRGLQGGFTDSEVRALNPSTISDLKEDLAAARKSRGAPNKANAVKDITTLIKFFMLLQRDQKQ